MASTLNKMLIIVISQKNKSDICVLIYNNVYHILKNKKKQISKNNFDLIFVKAKLYMKNYQDEYIPNC